MTVEDWWNGVKNYLSWAGAIGGLDWEELWPEAQEALERIFDAAREGMYDDLDVRDMMERLE